MEALFTKSKKKIENLLTQNQYTLESNDVIIKI
jgi:hypothetical protein